MTNHDSIELRLDGRTLGHATELRADFPWWWGSWHPTEHYELVRADIEHAATLKRDGDEAWHDAHAAILRRGVHVRWPDGSASHDVLFEIGRLHRKAEEHLAVRVMYPSFLDEEQG